LSDLLDSTVKKENVHDGFSNLQDRIRHIFIDGLIVLIVSALIRSLVEMGNFFETREIFKLAVIGIMLTTYSLYYSLLEFYFGFTIGKLLNKTRVVSLNTKGKPNFSQVLIRTLTRLIPIGFVTIVTPYRATVHDLFSKTRTIRIKKKYVIKVNEI
jgi:uncharacterized RDD family membrane protein YckC